MTQQPKIDKSTCKVCKCPVTLVTDSECPELHIEVWKTMVCCNRCHAYAMRLCRLKRYIVSAAMKVHTVREIFEFKPDSKDEVGVISRAAREKLVELTKAVAKAICQRWNQVMVWEPDFVEQIMEKPNQAGLIVNFYEDMVCKQAHHRVMQNA